MLDFVPNRHLRMKTVQPLLISMRILKKSKKRLLLVMMIRINQV